MNRAIGARTAIAMLCVAAAALLAACGSQGEPDPRPLTTEESQLLAITRFKNYDGGVRSVSVQVQDGAHFLSVYGYFDYQHGVGYASLLDDTTQNSLLMWQGTTLAVHGPRAGLHPLPPPDADTTTGLAPAWVTGALDPSASTLHAALAIIAGLGNDRPENPLLIQQRGALWLREAELYGVPVTVFAGPTATEAGGSASGESRIRYWVAADGLLVAVEAKLGEAWYTIELGPADDVALDYSVAAAE